MPLREDRIHRYVVAFCPHCHQEEPERPLEGVERLSGYLAEADGRVWLVRGCPRHGKVVTLYDENPEILTYLEQWTAPTKHHLPDVVGNFDPVPAAYLRGLGEMQTQHTCILLEDITESCNLRCPTCFADSAPALTGMASPETVLANIDARLSRENGRLDVVMISGGEPTVYPGFTELGDRVLERDIVRVLVNTNGIELSRDDQLLQWFRRNRSRVEVYLQFDGFRKETYLHHRRADLRTMKQRAIQRLSDAGVFTTLTMTASLGVNDDEIGDVIMHALDTPFVGGVSIQPVFGSGRSGVIDPLERLTHTGVLSRLGPQTADVVSWQDLIALPCSHPHCCSVGYMLMTDDGSWKSLCAIIGHDRLLQHLDLVSNRIVDPILDADLKSLVKESLLGLFSEQSSLSHPAVGELWHAICDNCDLGISSLLRLAGARAGNQTRLRDMLARRVKRITIKPFMDINTMIEERLLQCCVHVGTRSADQDLCAPFCAVQAWDPLARMKLPTASSSNAVQVSLGRGS
ncbi:MAG: radical SAM protein [Acidimicrobiia bacterium]